MFEPPFAEEQQINLLPLSPRFRGREKRLMRLYACFLDAPAERKALHPMQIARTTGLSIMDVNTTLQATPELFVRVPSRDRTTRYRLTSQATAMDEAAITAMIRENARREQLVMWSASIMVGCILIFVLATLLPWDTEQPEGQSSSTLRSAPVKEQELIDAQEYLQRLREAEEQR